MDNAPGTVAITGGRLLTVSHGVIENGVIVLSGGKIAAVGGPRTAIPAEAHVVDAKGMTVYPGLVDAETNLGLIEVEADQASNDLAEPSDEIMPQIHVADAFHAESVRIPVARLNGVTNAIVAPASEDSMAGQDAFIQLYGRDRDQMILTRDVALAMNFSGKQRRLSGGRSGGSPKYPTTRMGLATQLRQTFLDAQNYMETMEKKPDEKKGPPKRDLKLEALIPYLKGEKPVVLGAHEGYEVEVAMEVAQEFHLKVILSHVEHSQEMLDKIASYHVPVIVGPIYTAPAANQRYDAVFSLPAQLQKRGVKIALASYDTQHVRNLPYAAGYAVAYGLPYEEALKAITLNPAEMFGMGDKLGSLDVGKMANVVIANGDPLDVKTDVKQVYVQGIAVPMESRQTQLRDQYMKK
jgi:imidazolonepropionase-like amidohydrolase